MFRIPPRRALRLAVVLAAAGGLFATGCGQTQAGAAALVGDQRIAVDELSRSVDSAEQAAAENQLRVSDRGALVRGVLSREITDAVLGEAAARAGITVTRGDVDEQIAEMGGRQRLEMQALRSAAVPPGQLREYVRNQVLQQRLAESLAEGEGRQAQQSALVEHLRGVAGDMGVTVSPRYGRFNAEQLAVTQEQSRLSTPDPDSGGAAATGLDGPGGPGGTGSGGSGRGGTGSGG